LVSSEKELKDGHRGDLAGERSIDTGQSESKAPPDGRVGRFKKEQ
jgi:hypothetical protein